MSTTSFRQLGRVTKGRAGKVAAIGGVVVLAVVIYGFASGRSGLAYGVIVVAAVVAYVGLKAKIKYVERNDFKEATEALDVDKSAVKKATEHHDLTSLEVAQKPSRIDTTAEILDSMQISDVKGRIAKSREEEMKEQAEKVEEHVGDQLDIMARQAIKRELGPPANRTNHRGEPLNVKELDTEHKKHLAELYLEDEYSSDIIKNFKEGGIKGAITTAAIESAAGKPETPELDEALNLDWIDSPESIPYRVEITDTGVDLPFDVESTVDIDPDVFDEKLEVGDLVIFDIDLAEGDEEGDETRYRVSNVTNVRFIHENEDNILNSIDDFEEDINQTVDSITQANELRNDGVLTDAEYQDQFDDFLSRAQSLSPDFETMKYINKLQTFREHNTISEDTFEEKKKILLDPQSVIVERMRELYESGDISNSEFKKTKQTLSQS